MSILKSKWKVLRRSTIDKAWTFYLFSRGSRAEPLYLVSIFAFLNFFIAPLHFEIPFINPLESSQLGSQFGPTCGITTASYNNSILDLNTPLERILSVLLSCNKILQQSFTSIVVICSQVPPKCYFYLKIPISRNSTYTAKIRMKNVFPEIDTIFFLTLRDFLIYRKKKFAEIRDVARSLVWFWYK